MGFEPLSLTMDEWCHIPNPRSIAVVNSRELEQTIGPQPLIVMRFDMDQAAPFQAWLSSRSSLSVAAAHHSRAPGQQFPVAFRQSGRRTATRIEPS